MLTEVDLIYDILFDAFKVVFPVIILYIILDRSSKRREKTTLENQIRLQLYNEIKEIGSLHRKSNVLINDMVEHSNQFDKTDPDIFKKITLLVWDIHAELKFTVKRLELEFHLANNEKKTINDFVEYTKLEFTTYHELIYKKEISFDQYRSKQERFLSEMNRLHEIISQVTLKI